MADDRNEFEQIDDDSFDMLSLRNILLKDNHNVDNIVLFLYQSLRQTGNKGRPFSLKTVTKIVNFLLELVSTEVKENVQKKYFDDKYVLERLTSLMVRCQKVVQSARSSVPYLSNDQLDGVSFKELLVSMCSLLHGCLNKTNYLMNDSIYNSYIKIATLALQFVSNVVCLKNECHQIVLAVLLVILIELIKNESMFDKSFNSTTKALLYNCIAKSADAFILLKKYAKNKFTHDNADDEGDGAAATEAAADDNDKAGGNDNDDIVCLSHTLLSSIVKKSEEDDDDDEDVCEWSLFIVEKLLKSCGFLRFIWPHLSFIEKHLVLDLLHNECEQLKVLETTTTSTAFTNTIAAATAATATASTATTTTTAANLAETSREKFESHFNVDALRFLIELILKSYDNDDRNNGVGANNDHSDGGDILKRMLKSGPSNAHISSVKRNALSLVANITFKNKTLQDLLRGKGGIEAILNMTAIDKFCPTNQQWALLAIHSLCVGNPENQEYISKLKVERVSELNNDLRSVGVNVKVVDGRLRFESS
ncbi:hypothetical protein HELRODRAFT_163710 [Helobdella robusta]|uniref:Ataxin-10 n=1 Tax=Helobdella robusta TaxID=6412 RepID=T1EUD9_HELRO|nr:hypothetical protein HELRODRAFT_163710 [Helobdella robusta]ESN96621.1 hypothetical protein HELRODRAFT_163710 [Helobdella robusta]